MNSPAVSRRDRDTLVAGEFSLSRAEFSAIAALLRADAGIHMPEAKATLVYSRLVRRLRALNLAGFEDYCALLGADEGADERRQMVSALTTNVTRFFREQHHFDHLRERVLPPLLEAARRGGRARIWSAACSSGQEAYSVALTILALEPNAAALDIKVLATDIDPAMIAEGRRGVYAQAALADVPALLARRHFAALDEGAREWRAGEALRALVAFRELNLNAAWPMRGTFDAIFCRNVVIYFDAPTQQALWTRFAARLAPGGHLYIGHSERVAGPAAANFAAAGVTTYRLKDGCAP